MSSFCSLSVSAQEPPFKFVQVNGFNGSCVPEVLPQHRLLEVEAYQVPAKPVEGKGCPEPGEPQHVEVEGQQHGPPLRYRVMLQPVAGTGRLQVGQEQIPECRLGRWGAGQPEHRLPLGAFRYVMEVRKAGVQVEVALLEATCALHQLQRRVHALPDEQRLYWGVRVVAGLDAPPGEDTQIIKGKKLFDHPVSMDICKICARLCQDRIKEKVRNHYFTELFFSEYHGRYFSFEIQNVRAERRESRDLMQDLEDIRNGIQIVHASDMEKRDSENKRERRRQSRESAVRRLEKKLLESGYESLKEYSTDRRHADKWLGPERIAELEKMRQLKEKEEKEQPVQLSLFDMEAL